MSLYIYVPRVYTMMFLVNEGNTINSLFAHVRRDENLYKFPSSRPYNSPVRRDENHYMSQSEQAIYM